MSALGIVTVEDFFDLEVKEERWIVNMVHVGKEKLI